MAITNATLTLNPANIYVSSGNTVVSTMYFCNYGPTAANLNVWAVPNTLSAQSDVHLIYREVQIAAADTFVIDMEKLALQNGEQIKANAGGFVSATINYVGI
jgi:hypothetical protein